MGGRNEAKSCSVSGSSNTTGDQGREEGGGRRGTGTAGKVSSIANGRRTGSEEKAALQTGGERGLQEKNVINQDRININRVEELK